MRETQSLDEVWFVVSPQNPFKAKEGLLDEKIRLELLRLAIADTSNLKASDVEFSLPQPSYTIDTLDKLKSSFSKHRFKIIMGSDNLAKLDSWKDASRLISENHFLVYPRLGYNNGSYDEHPNFTFCNLPIVELSSTDIRKRLKSKSSIQFLVHKNVHDAIKKRNLYQ